MKSMKPSSNHLLTAPRSSVLMMAGVLMTSLLLSNPVVVPVNAGQDDNQRSARTLKRSQDLATKASAKAQAASLSSSAAASSLSRASAAADRVSAYSAASSKGVIADLVRRVIRARNVADQAAQDAQAASAEAQSYALEAEELVRRQAAGEEIKTAEIRRAKRKAFKAGNRATAATKLATLKSNLATRLSDRHAALIRDAAAADSAENKNGSPDQQKVLVAGEESDAGSQLDGTAEAISQYGFDPASRGDKPWSTYDEYSGNVDAMGWTILPVAADARLIYVSSSEGDDSADGLSTATPKKTIAAGKLELRPGFPDRLLMKRGDVFYEAIGILSNKWNTPNPGILGGRSEAEPMVFGAYGVGDRPLLKIGAESGARLWDDEYQSENESSSHLAFVGLHFYAQTRDPESTEFTGIAGGEGIGSVSRGRNLLIEDCRFDYCGIVIQASKNHGDPDPRFEDLKIRRNVIYGNYSNGGHAQGIFISDTDGILLEENVLDHNGWNELVGAKRTVFNHNVYITSYATGLIARGNILARGSSSGIQARPGGIIENNLFVGNAAHLNFGWVWGPPPVPGGVTGRVVGNIILDGTMVNPNGNSGEQALYGMRIGNIRSATIKDNIVLRTGPILLDSLKDDKFAGITNLELSNNKVSAEDFAVGVYSADFRKVAFRNNVFGARKYTYKDRDGGLAQVKLENTTEEHRRILESIGDYYARFGGDGTADSYFEEARKQQKGNWRWLYTGNFATDWLRKHAKDN